MRNSQGPMRIRAVGTAKTCIEGTTKRGAVGIAETGAMGMAGAAAEGISIFATTLGPSKVFAKYENIHTNKRKL